MGDTTYNFLLFRCSSGLCCQTDVPYRDSPWSFEGVCVKSPGSDQPGLVINMGSNQKNGLYHGDTHSDTDLDMCREYTNN